MRDLIYGEGYKRGLPYASLLARGIDIPIISFKKKHGHITVVAERLRRRNLRNVVDVISTPEKIDT